MDWAGLRAVPGQSTTVATESVTVTGARRTSPVFVTTISTNMSEPASTATIGTAGSTSASRQTWMSGGAVELACNAVADQVAARWAAAHGLDPDEVMVREGFLHTASGEAAPVAVADALPGERFMEALQKDVLSDSAYAARSVVILAHSRGGLISRAYLSDPEVKGDSSPHRSNMTELCRPLLCVSGQ